MADYEKGVFLINNSRDCVGQCQNWMPSSYIPILSPMYAPIQSFSMHGGEWTRAPFGRRVKNLNAACFCEMQIVIISVCFRTSVCRMSSREKMNVQDQSKERRSKGLELSEEKESSPGIKYGWSHTHTHTHFEYPFMITHWLEYTCLSFLEGSTLSSPDTESATSTVNPAEKVRHVSMYLKLYCRCCVVYLGLSCFTHLVIPYFLSSLLMFTKCPFHLNVKTNVNHQTSNNESISVKRSVIISLY